MRKARKALRKALEKSTADFFFHTILYIQPQPGSYIIAGYGKLLNASATAGQYDTILYRKNIGGAFLGAFLSAFLAFLMAFLAFLRLFSGVF